MKYIEIPETVKMGGKEAIESLNEFIKRLEQQTSDELTPKQKSVIITVARGLISSIENEMEHGTVPKQTEKVSIMKQIRNALTKSLDTGPARDANAGQVGAEPTGKPNVESKSDLEK